MDDWAKVLSIVHVAAFIWILLFILSSYNFIVSSSAMNWYFEQGPGENAKAPHPLA
jgi:Plasma-membrane choline transporter